MIPVLAAYSAAKPLVKLGVWLVAAALLVLGVWWACFLPRQQLADVRAEYAAYQAKMIEATTKAAEKARAAQAAIDNSLKEYRRESDFAGERAKIALENARNDSDRRLAELRRSGDDRVRNAWTQCLARPAESDRADLAEGSAHLSDDGKAALGPVLAIGRAADVQYARAIAELMATRKLLGACYAGQP